MPLVTRKPTGQPPWPILLIAGVEKSGKSYASAEASASDMIGRTLWIAVGEDEPDELGALPGARFEIVAHNGTYAGIMDALSDAVDALAGEEKPGLIVLDSGTRLWNLLADEAQAVANQRAAKKAAKYNRSAPTEDVAIGMDLWNRAKGRWEAVIDLLREHKGPSIITARLDLVTVVNDKGDPTGERDWKVQAHKSLPWDVGAIVQMPEPGKAVLTGVRSLRVKGATDKHRPFPGFTVEKLWREMGLDQGASERAHAPVDASASVRADEAADATRDAKARLWAVWKERVGTGADDLAHVFADVMGVTLAEAVPDQMLGFAKMVHDNEVGGAPTGIEKEEQ